MRRALFDPTVPIEPVARLVVMFMYFANLKATEIERLTEADCIAPSSACVAWRLLLDSRPVEVPWVYALPPLGEALAVWFKAVHGCAQQATPSGEMRLQSPQLLVTRRSASRHARVVFGAAATMANLAHDTVPARELAEATPHRLHGALEFHAGHDRAFIRGFIAHACGIGAPIAAYCANRALDDDEIQRGWQRLAAHWRPYDDTPLASERSAANDIGQTDTDLHSGLG